MSDRLIVVTAASGQIDHILAVADQPGVVECSIYAQTGSERPHAVHLLVADAHRQTILDHMQTALGGGDDWRITILPVEATIPREEPEPDADEKDGTAAKPAGKSGETREELYAEVARNARLDRNFIVFVILSTIVAAIGLVENDVAVVIGAMVIAPLLGPNLAAGLGVALGDRELILRALGTTAAGVAISVAIGFAIGLIWPHDFFSDALIARTDVGFAGMVLALASGAAAAISLSSGLSSALVGVMVAVALLPPATTIGLMLGAGRSDLAFGAALLLSVNIVCVNLSAQVAFVVRGVTPRTWFEKKTARRGVIINAAIWVALLAALALLLYLRSRHV